MAASHSISHAHDEFGLKRTRDQRTTIDRMLECAVTLNWKDLTKSSEATSIQVQYRTGPQHCIEYLKLWSSKQRGYWRLLAEYWMHSGAAHESGVIFIGDNYSADLALMLDAIMQHQEDFLPPSSEFLDGLVQIKTPTEGDLDAARGEMTEAMNHIGCLVLHA